VPSEGAEGPVQTPDDRYESTRHIPLLHYKLKESEKKIHPPFWFYISFLSGLKFSLPKRGCNLKGS
jgi:hypothetical protein